MYEAVLSRFAARPTRPGFWVARCPAHADRRPSLSLWLGRSSVLLIGCHAGCRKCDILRAVGLTMSDLFPDKQTDEPVRRRVVKTYDYRNEAGQLLYQKLRYEPKSFAQRRPDPSYKDGWAYHLGDVRRVLYRLPELLEHPAWPVLLCEGEKDADALAALAQHWCPTTAAEGAGWQSEGRWRPEYSETLRNRRVVILPDNDTAGLSYAYYAAGSLLAHGVGSLRIVQLPGLQTGGDVSDYLGMVGAEKAAQSLVRLIRQAAEWLPSAGAA